MSGIKMEVKGDNLVITIDTSKASFDAASPSQSGKTKVLASTRGFTGVSTPLGTVKVSLNATV